MNSRARGWSSVWLALRSLLWTILLPGVFAGYVPWLFAPLKAAETDRLYPSQSPTARPAVLAAPTLNAFGAVVNGVINNTGEMEVEAGCKFKNKVRGE